jgi:hypothetical protein
MALTLRVALGCGASRERGGKRRRLFSRGIWKLQRGANDAGDEGSRVMAYTAGCDAFKQGPALLAAQEEAKKAVEKLQPLQHRDTHDRSGLIYRFSGACLIERMNNERSSAPVGRSRLKRTNLPG